MKTARGDANGGLEVSCAACQRAARHFGRRLVPDQPHTLLFAAAPMSSYSTNEFKSGLKIMLDGDPYVIVENEFVKPGKGQAFNRVRIRNLKTGRTLERNFKSGDTVEGADIVETEMQYLYSDGDFWHFMVPENFEQHTAGKEAMGDSALWLKDGTMCTV